MRIRTMTAIAVAVVTVAAGGAFAPSASADAWAPAATAAIHPGVQTRSAAGQCTANFVFADRSDVYIGQAAHCTSLDAATVTNGCIARSLPLGTQVRVGGASQPGTLAYSSWLTMRARGERNSLACDYNDFALIKLHRSDHAKVNPSIPFWGGPAAIGGPTRFGEQVYAYGNSSLRLGIAALSPKTGVSLGTTDAGWAHPVYTASPGIPGDSGSAYLDEDGNALGVLSTLVIAPYTGSNHVIDLGRALSYLRANGGPDVDLVPGTEPFRRAAVLGR